MSKLQGGCWKANKTKQRKREDVREVAAHQNTPPIKTSFQNAESDKPDLGKIRQLCGE